MKDLVSCLIVGFAASISVGGCAGAGALQPQAPAVVSTAGSGGGRTLFIAIEAVPYAVALEAFDSAPEHKPLFAGFRPPAALVSSFPSTSSIAFTGILEPLGVGPAPGYEAHFFDRERNKVRGGFSFSSFKIPFSWRDAFDWRRKNLWRRGVEKLNPIKKGVREIRDGLDAFRKSEKGDFLVYLALPDASGHLLGPDTIKESLYELDRQLVEFRRRHPGVEFHTVIFSDHGMTGGEPLVNVREDVIGALESSGWRIRERLKKPRDAVFAPFGLVSSFEIFTQPGRGGEAAAVVTKVPGVALCAVQGDGGWRLISAGGGATVKRREGSDLWSYEPGAGDPLGYLPVLEKLRARAAAAPAPAAEEPWFPDEWWFEETLDTFYPDALYRVSRSFDLVRNPASATCSLEPGHMFGAKVTAVAARLSVGKLRWTHGALYRDASLGFLITDHPAWGDEKAVRFDHALRAIVGSPAPPLEDIHAASNRSSTDPCAPARRQRDENGILIAPDSIYN